MNIFDAISVVLSVLAIIISFVAFLRTNQRQRPRINVTSNNSILVYGNSNKAEFLLIELTIVNLSDVTNSILEYGLVLGPPYNNSTRPIYYSETDLGESILESPHGSPFGRNRLALHETRLGWLSNPANLPPHESRSGWIGFPLPSVPQEIVKDVLYQLYIIPSEGRTLISDIDLALLEWHKQQGYPPQNPDTLI